MKRIAALRITGDICFFYAIISLLSIFDPWQRPMAIFAPLCLAAALAATGIRQAPLRFLLSLVPGACFLLAKPALSMVVPLLPWLYFILSLTLGRFHMEISDYRKAFRWMLGTCVILVVAYTVSSMLFGSKTVPVSSVAYLAAYLLLGVCALRWMQMGTTMDARWQGVNLLTIVTVLVAAVGVAVLVYQLFIHSRPVILFLIAPFRLLLKWLFGLFGRREFAEHHVQDLNPERSDSILPTGSAVFEDSTTAEDGDVELFNVPHLPDQLLNIGAFIIVAFLLAMIVWVIVKLVRRGAVLAEGPNDYEATEEYTPGRRHRKSWAPAVHGRAQTVRMLYRQYLEYLKDNGLQRSASDTSEEILARSAGIAGTAPEAEETLRRVYLKARYSAAKVTDEDVAAARSSLDAIRGKDRESGQEPREESE